MKNRDQSSKNRLHNDLDWLDPDQPLTMDETYPEEIPEPEMTLRESISYGLRSTLAVIICLVIPALWYFDWNPSDIANRTSGAVSGLFSEVPVLPPLPAVEVPQAPALPVFLDRGIIDYMSQLKEQGLIEELSSPAIRAFYENNLPIDFLADLGAANLLDELSFPAVVAFYQNGVPIAYIVQLQDLDLLEELSFPAVVSFFQNKVSLDYLTQLWDADLLEGFSFPGIVAFYQNDIPIDFLEQLRDRALLEFLSSPDIINMYQSQ